MNTSINILQVLNHNMIDVGVDSEANYTGYFSSLTTQGTCVA